MKVPSASAWICLTRPLYRTFCVLGLILLLATTLPAQAGVNERLESLIKEIRQEYAYISHVGVDDIDLQDKQTVLIDVREPQEYAVSRLPNALNINNNQKLLEFALANPDAKLVLYCSVGRRSAEKVGFLKQRGIRNANNMLGSIFAWANDGLPMENGQGATLSVHPYNWFWGWRYLDGSRRARVP